MSASTRTRNKVVLEILWAMRPHVERSLNPYYHGYTHLCTIFSKVKEELGLTNVGPDSQTVIGSRIAPHITYEAWLHVHHQEQFEEMLRLYHNGRMTFQEGRLQWLDSLIAEYEEKTR